MPDLFSPILTSIAAAQQGYTKALADLAAANATIQQQAAALLAAQSAAQQGAGTAAPRELGVNLEAIAYWSRGLYFADAMLEAQNFWQGADAQGNPTTDEAILVFENGPATWAGTYKLVCNGQPTLGFQASYGTVANQAYNAATDTTTADITITADQLAAIPQLGIKFSNVVAGKVRNVQLWRPGATIGQRYYAPFIKLLAPFDVIRFMPFQAINGNPQKNWADRPLPTDRNYQGTPGSKGGCIEDCLGIAKAAGKIPWICVPPQADADYVANLIALIQQQTTGPVYLESGNEWWNFGFPEWMIALTAALADPDVNYDNVGDQNIRTYRWIAKKAVQIGQAACAAYGVNDIRKCPIRPVLAAQWGNPAVLQYGLDFVNAKYGPPKKLIFAGAIAPYATNSGGLLQRVNSGDATVTEQQIVADWQANGIQNASINNAGTKAFIATCNQYGLAKKAYEFGFDDGQGQGDLAQKTAANHDPAIGAVETAYIKDWFAAGADGLNWFTLTWGDSASGNWGLLADTMNPADPKYVAASAAAMNLLP